MDSTNLTYEKIITDAIYASMWPHVKMKTFNITWVSLTNFALVSDLALSKGTNSEASVSFLVPELLSMLRFASDFCPTYTLKSMSKSLIADSDLLQDREPFCGERHYHRDCSLENVAAITAAKIVTRKASVENPLRAVRCDRTQTTRER
ncbi:unnamed protein product [Hymenolepis diminuta]|uniref:Uncharacterized protein n=1 Tax=Hymenolepis diminuta TaxID=6216 RepID=A0A0R3SDA1_HYMDI|nr:unnamed protein product [Hymenolepis diminuta]